MSPNILGGIRIVKVSHGRTFQDPALDAMGLKAADGIEQQSLE
jgi:hypothetical protein